MTGIATTRMIRDQQTDTTITTDVILDALETIGASYLATFIEHDTTRMTIETDKVARALNVPSKIRPYVQGYELAIDDIDNLVSRLRRDGYAIGYLIVDADRDADLIVVSW